MERYEMPGFVDFHLHMGWTDFDHVDQDKRSEKDVKDRILFCLKELSNMGFRMVRDAGGLETIGLDKNSRKDLSLPSPFFLAAAWSGARKCRG